MRTVDCPYTVTFYGALFREGDVWICMECMDASLEKFYSRAFRNEKIINEDVLGKIAFCVSSPLLNRGTLNVNKRLSPGRQSPALPSQRTQSDSQRRETLQYPCGQKWQSEDLWLRYIRVPGEFDCQNNWRRMQALYGGNPFKKVTLLSKSKQILLVLSRKESIPRAVQINTTLDLMFGRLEFHSLNWRLESFPTARGGPLLTK